jgi:hypothetical protein
MNSLMIVMLASLFPFPMLGALLLAERVMHPESKPVR